MPAFSMTLLGLLIVLVLPAGALYIRFRTDAAVSWPAIRRGLVLQWVVTLALLGLVVATAPDVLGAFGSPGGDPVMDTLVAFILVGVFGLGTTLGAKLFSSVPVDDLTRTILGLSRPRKLALAVTAGITEELVLRGFLITQLEALGVSVVVAAFVALVLAVAAHAARRSAGRLLLGVPLQAAFVLAFVVTGNVVACLVAHVCYDVLVLFTTGPDDLPA